MKPLLIDASPVAFLPVNQAQVDGETRYYYAAEAPWRIILVCRGAELASFPVDTLAGALVGWEPGQAGFCRPGQEGKQHTKISLSQWILVDAIDGQPVPRLSEIIAKAPRSDRRGGARPGAGRESFSGDEGSIYLFATITKAQETFLRRLGHGDLSAGARSAIDLAINHEDH